MRGLHSDTEASPEPSEKKYFTLWHDKTNKQINNNEKTRNTWKQTAHSVILRSQRCHLICSENIKICREANIGTQTLHNKASFEDLHRHWQSDHPASICEGKSFLNRRGQSHSHDYTGFQTPIYLLSVGWSTFYVADLSCQGTHI